MNYYLAHTLYIELNMHLITTGTNKEEIQFLRNYTLDCLKGHVTNNNIMLDLMLEQIVHCAWKERQPAV